MNKPLPHSIDARDWAKEFCRTARNHPWLAQDEGTMISWFSSAIMAGYDEANRRRAAVEEQHRLLTEIEERIAKLDQLRRESEIQKNFEEFQAWLKCTCERDPSLVCPVHDKPCGCPKDEFCSH